MLSASFSVRAASQDDEIVIKIKSQSTPNSYYFWWYLSAYRSETDCVNKYEPIHFLVDSANQQLNLPHNWMRDNDSGLSGGQDYSSVNNSLSNVPGPRAAWGNPANLIPLTQFWVYVVSGNSEKCFNLVDKKNIDPNFEEFIAYYSKDSKNPPSIINFGEVDKENYTGSGNFGVSSQVWLNGDDKLYMVASLPAQLKYKYAVMDFKLDDTYNHTLKLTNTQPDGKIYTGYTSDGDKRHLSSPIFTIDGVTSIDPSTQDQILELDFGANNYAVIDSGAGSTFWTGIDSREYDSCDDRQKKYCYVKSGVKIDLLDSNKYSFSYKINNKTPPVSKWLDSCNSSICTIKKDSKYDPGYTNLSGTLFDAAIVGFSYCRGNYVACNSNIESSTSIGEQDNGYRGATVYLEKRN